MTPPGGASDRLLIWVVALIVITCVVVSAILAWHGQAVAIAAFIGLAGTALGILSPSPLKQHSQADSETSVDAGNADTVNVNPPIVGTVAGSGGNRSDAT